MSEDAPERRTSGGGGFGGLLKEKLGPLPMWAWVAVAGAAYAGYRLYENYKSNQSAASTSTDTTPASDVPEFVNQTYTTVTAPGPPGPPGKPGAPGKPGKPGAPGGPEQLTRNWTAPVGGVSTLAEISQRLTGRPDADLLTPVNEIAKKFISGPYKKNKNAKVPKGAEFTYTEGTVTNKPPEKKK